MSRAMNHAEPAPVDDSSDEELVRRISATPHGPPAPPDTDAEQILCARYYQRVRFMLRQRTGNYALADDLTQDTFIILIQHLREHALRDPGKVPAYVLRTAHFVFIAWVRKEHRRPVTELTDDLPSLEARPEDEVQAQQSIRALLRVMDEMPVERDREILDRHWVRGQTKAEACKAIGVTPEHHDRVLSRAKKRFRELLDRKGFDRDDF